MASEEETESDRRRVAACAISSALLILAVAFAGGYNGGGSVRVAPSPSPLATECATGGAGESLLAEQPVRLCVPLVARSRGKSRPDGTRSGLIRGAAAVLFGRFGQAVERQVLRCCQGRITRGR